MSMVSPEFESSSSSGLPLPGGEVADGASKLLPVLVLMELNI